MRLSIPVKSWSNWSPGKISHDCPLRPYPAGNSRALVWDHVGWHFQSHEKRHFCVQGLKVLTYHLCKSLISDWFCLAQSYPRSGKRSVFEMWFSTGRNPLVRHCHPPSSSQHSCGAGTCCLLRYPETSVQTGRLTGTRWDGKQRESRTGGIGKLGEPFQKAKSIKSLQLECTYSFSKTIQLAQEPSSSSTPALCQ